LSNDSFNISVFPSESKNILQIFITGCQPVPVPYLMQYYKFSGFLIQNKLLSFPQKNMKSYRKELWFEIPSRRGFVNITGKVGQCLADSGIQEGLVLVNAMHITSSVFINDDEAGLHHDFEVWLEKLAPEKPHSQYHHNGYEDNADAHIKRTLMGREVVVAVTNGRLDFGTWEQIFYGEFDGKRKKRVLVKIIGE
jgi:secondary thiamine-phosphate synthase enzyme